MDSLVHAIEDASAKVDGSEPSSNVGSITKAVTDENGMRPAQSELKRRMSQDGPDAKRSKAEDVQSPTVEHKNIEVKPSNGVSVVDAPTEDNQAAVETTTISAPDAPSSKVPTEDICNELVIQPNDELLLATDDTLTVTDTDEEPTAAPVIPVTDIESQDESVVDLDSTIASSIPDPEENTPSLNDSDVVVISEPRLSQSEPAVIAEPSKNVGEVTLETPDVSICPLEKQQPLILTNHRISELVLSNGSSTPNTSQPTTAEFQATPIKKQDASITEEQEFTSSASDDTKAKSISSDDKTDEGMKRLQEKLKQINGTTTPDPSSAPSDAEDKSGTGYMSLADSLMTSPEEQLFETVVNFQNGTLLCLLVERVVRPVPIPVEISSDAGSEKSASNGSSITSLGPFLLPSNNMLMHTASGLSISSSSSASARPFVLPSSEKGRVQGISGLRTFLQELIKKLPEEEKKKTGRWANKTKAAGVDLANTKPAADKRAQTLTKRVTQSPEPEKKTVAFATTKSLVGNFVMARWTDKKYYAGRVSAEKPGNKYLIKFEDGATKTLAKDQIVFGSQTVAPLMNHECNVLVEPNVYETGLVVSVDAEACTYDIVTDSGTVTVLASDLYLDEDQAKMAQQTTAGPEESSSGSLEAPVGPSRRKRNSDVLQASPKAGPSSLPETAAKKAKKRPPPPMIQSSDTQLSDMSDTFESEPKVPEISFVEAVDGVQPELFTSPNQTKINLTCGLYKDDLEEDKLGDIPLNAALFRNKHVLLTATESLNRNPGASNSKQFSDYPFVMEYLVKQLKCGGATVYNHFEEIPKAKYKTCILITREPCLTARFIQCLALNMTVVSHGWVIESCRHCKLMDLKAYALPAGWSTLENNYVRYVTGRNEKRSHAHPFHNLSILISSENDDFIKFWTRVCKFVDAKVKQINSVLDITASKRTYMLMDSELLVANVEKAKAVGIPIVSTAWISECLIQGKLVDVSDHDNFTKANWDLHL